MGRSKRRKRNVNNLSPSEQTAKATIESLEFDQIDEAIARLQIQKSLSIQKSLESDDISQIIKASNYLKTKEKEKQTDPKSYFWVPDMFLDSGKGYKTPIKGVSFEVLQRMGNIPLIETIVKTRIEQIQRFLSFTTDEQKEGYTIRRKTGLFEDRNKAKLTDSDKRKIEELNNYLEYGGFNSKWTQSDDFADFIRKIMRDSLVLDQTTFEIVRNRGGKLQRHFATDASMIRLLDSLDPKFQKQFEQWEINGILPSYAQVWNGEILQNPDTKEPIIFYPWELGYGVRNKTTNIRHNGYGTSELEVLIEVVTWILWGMQYNGNFFKQGSNPKGFLTIKNGGMNNETLNEFRGNWKQMMTGVENSHRMPVFEGIDLEWTDLQKNNRDMEYNSWVEFLIIMLCSVYTIDPSELGFHFRQQSELFGQQGQKERLDHSKKKGLVPLLKFLEKLINKYLISELDENYEFVFTGIDIEDRKTAAETIKAELDAGIVPFEVAFEQKMGRPYNEKKDTILNREFIQILQMKQMGGEEMNGYVEGMQGEEENANPFEQYEKAGKSDPIIASAIDYINKTLK